MKPSIPRLPDGELEVMQSVWACESPMSRKEIEAVLFEAHPMAMTTLLTMLSRLSDKGFVEITKVGRSAQYAPLVSQEDYLAAQGNRFLHKLCGGSISALANALCGSGLSKEELAQLRDLLERDAL